MSQCPHCGQSAITVLRKSILGPGVPVACRCCGQSVKMGFPAWLKAAIPGTAVMVGALLIDSEALMYAVSFAGMGLMIGLQLLWVPLIKEQ